MSESRQSERAPFSAILVLVVSVLIGAGIIGWRAFEHQRAEFGSAGWTPENIDESMRRGDVIMAALIEFRRAHSQWPGSLGELTPAFIAMIEPPTCGHPDWRYTVIASDDACRLACCANGSCYPTAWITSDAPSDWSIDQ